MSQCGSKFHCKRCRHKHHTSLCKPNHEESQPNDRDDKGNKDKHSTEQSDTTSHVTLTPVSCDTHSNTYVPEVNSICLLQTTIAPVHAGHTRILANILFNEGVQRSFITEDLVTELNLQPISYENIAVASFGTESPSNQRLPVAKIDV